jgi:hypothetical protein
LTQFVVPASVHVIGTQCFSECASLASVTFESRSERLIISEDAFDGAACAGMVCFPALVCVAADVAERP